VGPSSPSPWCRSPHTPRSSAGATPCAPASAAACGAEEIAGHDFTAPTIVVLGNETAGLSRAYRDACDARVRIPMHGAASSLNVAVAASVMLYEAARQRRAAGASPRSLAPPGQ
jgi:tRNA C32,U32 (ribose-2'-O)-methylase TrmJ